MRRLYSLAWWLAMPLVLARLWWRGRREPGYRRHLGERFGWYADSTVFVPAAESISADPSAGRSQVPQVPQVPQVLWVHAVSVGETRAAEPLIDALLTRYPDHRLLLTHMTPTGRATGAALYAHYGERFEQRYLPYDTGLMMGRLLERYQPRICLLIETEVWPNLVACCRRRGTPVMLVSARLSARSLARGERLGSLIGDAARALDGAGAQTSFDAARLARLGVAPVQVTGSLKFDVTPPQAQLELGARWRRQFGQRSVLLCASTREGEEAAILQALQVVPLDALLVMVPRHPQRFEQVAELVASHGLRLLRRSLMGSEAVAPEVRVLLGDSMGEMFAYYAAADVAFIGGSLQPLGGQNLIEACAVGIAVLVGPHTFNFAAVAEDAIAAGAALRIEDAPALLASAHALLGDGAVRTAMAGASRNFAGQHRGATARTMAMIETLMQ